MNTPLTYFLTPAKKETKSIPLSVNGQDITSLQMLLSKTEPEELYPLLHDHSLLHWLVAQGLESTAYSLAHLLRTLNFTPEFRNILGFSNEHNLELSDEELVAYNERKNYLRQFTSNESILSTPYSVALTQTELNEILFLGNSEIYLCDEVFQIPLEIANVHYIGIGNAVIKHPLSKEEYLLHGITIDGIPLPENEIFSETIDNNTTAIQKTLRARYMDVFCVNRKVPAHVDHKNRYVTAEGAENNGHAMLKNIYRSISASVFPNRYGTIAKRTIAEYTSRIHDFFGQTVSALYNKADDAHLQQILYLSSLVTNAKEYFAITFEQEFQLHPEQYTMPDYNSFVSITKLEKYRVSKKDLRERNLFERIYGSKYEYELSYVSRAARNMFQAEQTIATRFAREANRIYREYFEKIERLIAEISAN